jgi:uncharacterized protein (DUF302 family)
MRIRKNDLYWTALCLMALLGSSRTAAAVEPVSTSVSVPVEHIRLVSAKPFDEVAAALEHAIPELDPGVIKALASGDEKRAAEIEKGQKLFIFSTRNHGALLASIGRPEKARQYEIGNPMTAARMVRHQLAAALYAPLRVVLYANPSGGSTFEYDRPSTLFGQFGDAQVTAVGQELDEELNEALTHAAE